MDLIPYAIPFFVVLIIVELLTDYRRGTRHYRVADAINSLSTGVLSTTTGLLTKGVGLVTYAIALDHLALFELPADSLWVWLMAFVVYDFCYYWLHRLGHERNILWAAHSVHHQSEEYNLSTALRQTSTGFLLSWIFYLPLAVLGVPLAVFITVAALNLLYQFWVHTRHIPKLGWYEGFFVTPSNHRAHHAQNPLYMDRNYGGVFILWDRLFGTFQQEDDAEPPVFGVTRPLASWNPLWANLQFYVQLAADARHAGSYRDKLRIWFMPTGWRPADVAAKYPMAKHDLARFRKFDVPLQLRQQVYIALQFAVYVALGSYQLRRKIAAGGAGAGLGSDAAGIVRARGGVGEPAVGVEAGSGAVTVECTAGLAGSAGRAVAGQPVGLDLGYSLLSAIGLYCSRGRIIRLAGS